MASQDVNHIGGSEPLASSLVRKISSSNMDDQTVTVLPEITAHVPRRAAHAPDVDRRPGSAAVATRPTASLLQVKHRRHLTVDVDGRLCRSSSLPTKRVASRPMSMPAVHRSSLTPRAASAPNDDVHIDPFNFEEELRRLASSPAHSELSAAERRRSFATRKLSAQRRSFREKSEWHRSNSSASERERLGGGSFSQSDVSRSEENPLSSRRSSSESVHSMRPLTTLLSVSSLENSSINELQASVNEDSGLETAQCRPEPVTPTQKAKSTDQNTSGGSESQPKTGSSRGQPAAIAIVKVTPPAIHSRIDPIEASSKTTPLSPPAPAPPLDMLMRYPVLASPPSNDEDEAVGGKRRGSLLESLVPDMDAELCKVRKDLSEAEMVIEDLERENTALRYQMDNFKDENEVLEQAHEEVLVELRRTKKLLLLATQESRQLSEQVEQQKRAYTELCVQFETAQQSTILKNNHIQRESTKSVLRQSPPATDEKTHDVSAQTCPISITSDV